MVNNIIRVYHDNMTFDIEKTVQGILGNYWFPSLRKHVNLYIENCITCLLVNSSSNSREGEIQLSESPSIPFFVIHIDHFGPINESELGYKYVFVVIDSFTWLFAVKNLSSKEVIKNLTLLFSMFGNPKRIVSDRGAFTSQEFENFLKEEKIAHKLIAVATSWANGLVERVNHFLKPC